MRRYQGITLIEVMIVVAIITVLAAIALPVFQDYSIRSQMTAGLADISAGKSLFESHLVANNIDTFDATDIGLPVSTPRCSEINLISGVIGSIECILVGHPLIQGEILSITRDASGTWHCTAPEDSQPKHRPSHCE